MKRSLREPLKAAKFPFFKSQTIPCLRNDRGNLISRLLEKIWGLSVKIRSNSDCDLSLVLVGPFLSTRFNRLNPNSLFEWSEYHESHLLLKLPIKMTANGFSSVVHETESLKASKNAYLD